MKPKTALRLPRDLDWREYAACHRYESKYVSDGLARTWAPITVQRTSEATVRKTSTTMQSKVRFAWHWVVTLDGLAVSGLEETLEQAKAAAVLNLESRMQA